MQYYTVKEVAEKLRVDHQTVRRWINDNKLMATKVGKGLRIREEDIQEFIKASN
jgi:excisionase family DNA binding protein